MRKLAAIGAYVLFGTFTFGCVDRSGNTTTGNPFNSLAVTGNAATATASNTRRPHWFVDWIIQPVFAYPPPNTLTDAVGSSVQLTGFRINVGEIEFRSQETVESNETDGTDISYSGPYLIDLFSASPSNLANSVVSMSEIRRIKMKLIQLTSAQTAPSGMLGKSIYLQGAVNGHSFTVSSAETSELQISGPNGLSSSTPGKLLVEVKTANLINRIDLSAINASMQISESNRVSATNPCPRISTGASDLYTCFRKGLESESNLGIDEDGDFKIGGSESAVK